MRRYLDPSIYLEHLRSEMILLISPTRAVAACCSWLLWFLEQIPQAQRFHSRRIEAGKIALD